MKVECSYDEMVPIKDLKPNPKNENEHTREQIERLAKILKYQGWRKPIIVSHQSGLMVTGHCSLAAAIHNGWTEIPVSHQNFSEDQETAHRVADNAMASWAHLNLGSVNLNLADMDPSFDVENFGIKSFQVEPLDKPQRGCPQCGYVKIKP